MKAKRILFPVLALTMLLARMKADTIDFSTTSPNHTNWLVTAGGAANVMPFCFKDGSAISITANGFRTGAFLPGGTLAQFDGFWTADFKFNIPANAVSAGLTFTNLEVDDRVALFLNGIPVSATGIFAAAGNGNSLGKMLLTDGGLLQDYWFSGPDGGVAGVVNSGFIFGGTNTLRAIVNNTDAGISGSVITFAHDGDATYFAVRGSVTYSYLPVTNSLKLWFNAGNVNGDGSNPADGATVGVWHDLGGLGLNLTPPILAGNTICVAPVYRANALNGCAGVDFSQSG